MSWPKIVFHDVPPTEVAETVAASVRHAVFGAGRGLISHCDLRKVCQVGGFEVRRARFGHDKGCSEALLIPMPNNQFRIALNADRIRPTQSVSDQIVRHRNRFRIAHEIAHSFFYDRSQLIPTKLTEDSSEEEKFCDLFASALLMPPNVVAAHAAKPESIFNLRRNFDVSIEAAARALSESYPSWSIVGLMWNKNARGADFDLRVQWFCGPRFIPKNARLHSKVASSAYDNGASGGTEELSIGELQGDFEARAAKAPGGMLVVMMLAETGDESIGNEATSCLPPVYDLIEIDGRRKLQHDLSPPVSNRAN